MSNNNLPNRRGREDSLMNFLDEITSVDYSLFPKNTTNSNNTNTIHRNNSNNNQDDNNNNMIMMMMMPASSRPPSNTANTNTTAKKPPLNTSNFVQTKINFATRNNFKKALPNQNLPPPPSAPAPKNTNSVVQNENSNNDVNEYDNNNNNNIDHQKDHRSLKQYLFISYLRQIRDIWNSRRMIRAEKNKHREMMMTNNHHGNNNNNNNMLVLSSDDDDDDVEENNKKDDDDGLGFLRNNNNSNSNNKNGQNKKNTNELNYDDDDANPNDDDLLQNNNNIYQATTLEKRTPVSVEIDMLKVVAISPIVGRKLAEDPESLFYTLLPSSLQGIVEETVQELQLIRNRARGRETEADKRIIITPANSHLPLLEKVLLGGSGISSSTSSTLQQQLSLSSSPNTTTTTTTSFRLPFNPRDDFPDLIKLLKPLRATQNICFRPQHLPPYFDVNAHEFSYSRHNNRLVVIRGTVIRHTPTRLVQYKVMYKCPSCEAGTGEPLVSALSQRLQGTNKPSCKKCKARPPMIPDIEWCKDYAECFVQRQNNNINNNHASSNNNNSNTNESNNNNQQQKENSQNNKSAKDRNNNNNVDNGDDNGNNNNFGGTLVIDDLVERRALKRRRRLRKEKLERKRQRQEARINNTNDAADLLLTEEEDDDESADDDDLDDEDNYDKPLFTDSEDSDDSGDEEFYENLEKEIRQAEMERIQRKQNNNKKGNPHHHHQHEESSSSLASSASASTATPSLSVMNNNNNDGGFTSKLPRSILVSLEDDLVRTCYPGLLVEITGICIARWNTAANGFTPDVQLMVHALNVTPLSQQNQIASGQNLASQRYFKNQKQIQRESNRMNFGFNGDHESNKNNSAANNNKHLHHTSSSGTSAECPIEVDDQLDDEDEVHHHQEGNNNNTTKSNNISLISGNNNNTFIHHQGCKMVLKSVDRHQNTNNHNTRESLSIVTLTDEKMANRLMNDRHAKAIEESSYCMDEIWKSPYHICSESEEEHISKQMFRQRLDPADQGCRDVFRLERRMETHRKVDDSELDRTPICYLTRRLHSNPFPPPPENLRLFSESMFQSLNLFSAGAGGGNNDDDDTAAAAAEKEFFSRQRAILLALRKQEQHHMSLCLTQFVRSRLLSEDEVHRVCEATRNFAVQLDQEVTHQSMDNHHQQLPNYIERIKNYEQKHQNQQNNKNNSEDGEEHISYMKKQVKLLQVFLKNFQLATDYQLSEFIGPDLFRTRLVLSVAPQLTGRFAERLSVLLCTIGGVRRQQNFENLRGMAMERLHLLEHELRSLNNIAAAAAATTGKNNNHQQQQYYLSSQQKQKRESILLLRSMISEIDHLHSLHNDTSVNSRSNIHLLFCGDPATGKSQILLASNVIALTSVYVMGVGTTSAGLTAAATKESGEWTLDPGALVLSNGGTCVIDELRTVSKDDRNSLHEAMEQQTVSCAKAGMVTSLRTDCSVVAACNPVQVRGRRGMMDGADMMAKATRLISIGVGSPLLSRFDLIFAMFDSGRFDDVIASHILTLNCMTIGQQQQQQHQMKNKNNNTRTEDDDDNDLRENNNNNEDASSSIDFNNMRRPESPAFNVRQLRDYCAACRQRCHHLRTVWWGQESELDRNLRLFKQHGGLNVDLSLSADAANLIDCYYKIQRAESNDRGGNGTMILEDTLLVTIRFLESLVRLTQAHAALVGRADVCLEEDAAMAIFLTEQSARALKFDLFASSYPSSAHLFEKVRQATTETEREKILEDDEFVQDPMLKIAVTMPYSSSNCDRWFLGTDSEHVDAQRIILQRLIEVVKTHRVVANEQNARNAEKMMNNNNQQQQEEGFDTNNQQSSVMMMMNRHEKMNQLYKDAHRNSSGELSSFDGLLNFSSSSRPQEQHQQNNVEDVEIAHHDDFTGKEYTRDELDDIDLVEEDNHQNQKRDEINNTFPGFMSSKKQYQNSTHHNTNSSTSNSSSSKSSTMKNVFQNNQNNNNSSSSSYDPSKFGFDSSGMKFHVTPAPEIQQELSRFEKRQATGEDDEAARNLLSQVSTSSNNHNNNKNHQRVKEFLLKQQQFMQGASSSSSSSPSGRNSLTMTTGMMNSNFNSNNNSASATPQFGLSQQSNNSNASNKSTRFPLNTNINNGPRKKDNHMFMSSSSGEIGGGPTSPGGETQCGDD